MIDAHDAGGLESARQTINEIDRQMAELFTQRMAAVADVAAYKAARSLPILDAERERQVVARNAALVPDDIQPYYVRFLEGTMEASRQYQHHLIEKG